MVKSTIVGRYGKEYAIVGRDGVHAIYSLLSLSGDALILRT